MFAGAALALGAAGPAAAEGPATGVPTHAKLSTVKLVLDGKPSQQAAIELTVGGKTVSAYCIDFHTKIALNERYSEGTWDESQVKNLGKVLWVLTHGYPNADAAKLVEAAGAKVPGGVDKDKLATLLYFGTQTAVWHFSDGLKLGDYVEGEHLLAKPLYDVVMKVRAYLVQNATDQLEPKPTLTITPANGKSVPAGEKLGPYTVAGPAGAITLSVTGGKAVDADGKLLTKTTNGGRFWLTGDGAGAVTVTAKGSGSVSFGRVFLYQGKMPAQKLILGGSLGETVTARATGDFTAPGAGGGLPVTGAATGVAVAAGLVLLAAGAVTVLVVRRRRLRFTA